MRLVLFVYIEMLKVAFEGYALGVVCIHRKVKCRFWRDLRYVLLLHRNVKVNFWRDLFFCCLYTS